MRLLTSVTVCILMAAAYAHASIQVTERELTPWGFDQDVPVISGDYVVYVEDIAGNDDVHMLIAGFGPYIIANGPSYQNEPAIDDSLIVYVDDGSGRDIFLYNIHSHATEQLSTAAADEFSPAISDSEVVYVSDRGGNKDLYRYSLRHDREYLVVVSLDTYEDCPAIDGDLIAWDVYESGFYNIKAMYIGGAPFVVANNPANERYPAVSGDLIAYVAGSDIGVYDAGTGETTIIETQAVYVSRVYVDGTSVVYSAKPSGNYDVFLHDIDTGETYQLTDDPDNQWVTDMDGERAVFWDERDGDKNVYLLEWFFNDPPVPDAGEDQYVDQGDTVYLSGSATDPEGHPVTEWQWEFSQLPFGSGATLDDPASQTPSFVADMAGDYVLSLSVTDSMDWSDPDYVTVNAQAPCYEPIAIVNVDPTEGEAPLEVTFDGSSSYDLSDPELYFEWDFGDESPFGSDPIVVHTYAESGEYDASLTLYNGCGEDVTVPISISVSSTGVSGDWIPRFALYPSVPNPFTRETTIAYDLAHATEVDLAIYDVSGRLVRRLRSNTTEGPGRHEALWDGRDTGGNEVAAGTYIYRLEASGYEASGRMTLVK